MTVEKKTTAKKEKKRSEDERIKSDTVRYLIACVGLLIKSFDKLRAPTVFGIRRTITIICFSCQPRIKKAPNNPSLC
ncbi:hypothetical protein A2470_04820 [Candidatus Curtissbacteria bacterium RIFOXYC2_FULL_41_11]|uniref:Uncharacterized protein n=1 Tax=Candidatus Curtissbacteria bacterium RIFOXYA1_FULL_41_14 TaxID=1797737 RepID=A0A1F5HFW1_9BACT|nr:MAG: hypothetical protein A3E14_02170 [Candidatus Curtissbacteria bacterium RIFCSPHIGHO2_12_FULL_41_13]OGE03041.1 MAG: hypothetical protein A2196_01240 [Candidatus Curtissbacteria bacterium RIFOXYA1_FULL_41_14]OGE11373.1 MAG: hypothetical protein A2470_04820 [Candidatus Curtissbacteria bacterium RIFOXYC2_FULL_41_11]OGE11969.1 MAG: hypothetical protein A2305_02685 [Candidatus Curtissbacteria bacterium RIFOXYB2_FULL_41_10]OGE18319.1 MAG: hypothetical protein A2495_00265 [Candidatus Curtissbact